jgi:hypothetical protein
MDPCVKKTISDNYIRYLYHYKTLLSEKLDAENSEIQLIKAFKRGDAQAFKSLFDRYHRRHRRNCPGNIFLDLGKPGAFLGGLPFRIFTFQNCKEHFPEL